jgi:hypothetical protein
MEARTGTGREGQHMNGASFDLEQCRFMYHTGDFVLRLSSPLVTSSGRSQNFVANSNSTSTNSSSAGCIVQNSIRKGRKIVVHKEYNRPIYSCGHGLPCNQIENRNYT